MPFPPVTPILDSFDRANEGPPPSANWTGPVFYQNLLAVVSNQLKCGAATGDAYWNPAQYGPDCQVWMKRVNNFDSALYIRLCQIGSGTTDGYFFSIGPPNGGLYRIDNGALTQLGATFTLTGGAGDRIGFDNLGSTLDAYTEAAGVWTQIATRTDSTYLAAGYIGVGLDIVAIADDFGGGNILGRTLSIAATAARSLSW